MATTRIKEKVSLLVGKQFPEFIREDYTTFISFVEAYYAFLEQDQAAFELIQNTLSYADIDSTAPSFVQYFVKQYLGELPNNALANNKLLIKRINDLYTSKGSELSFQLLFRILFNENVTVKHPSDYILRPSDGGWEQKVTVAATRTAGSTNDLADRIITYVNTLGVKYTVEVTRVKIYTNGIFEFSINTRNTVPFEIGGVINIYDGNGAVLFTGTIESTPVTYTIDRAGTGFKAGQIFTINEGGGENTLIKVTKVGSSGEIEKLRIINFGYGYGDIPFTVDISSTLKVAATTYPVVTKLPGYIEAFKLVKPHTITDPLRYFAEDYITPYTPSTYTATTLVNSTLTTSFTAVDTAGEKPADVATVTFTPGAVARHPGQYMTNRGFLSEPDVRLEDNGLYQPFAYQLEDELDISVFYDTVIKLLHPAGTKLFNNRTVTSSFDVSANVSVFARQNVQSEVYDTFATLDTVRVQIAKAFVGVSESANAIEQANIATYKPFSDDVDVLLETTTKLLGKVVLDDVTEDDTTTFSISKPLTDSQTLDEAFIKSVGLNINNNDSTVSLTESKTGFHVSYSDATYFAEYYVGEYITFT